jgi:sugar O-acyltransferase (sialic acid O-acetyltransferase NeuD family)
MKNVAIYGKGGLGRELADVVLRINPNAKIIFIDDFDFNNETIFSFNYIKENLVEFLTFEFAVAIGDIYPAIELRNKLSELGVKFATIIDPSVIISSSASISTGVLIFQNSWIGPNVVIEKNCIINASTVVGHDIIVREDSIISSGVKIGGGAIIGPQAYAGLGSIVLESIKIGKGSVLGAGAVLHKDLDDYLLAIGNPARPVRKIDENFRLF